ncbi:hypothetical protein RSAG8_11859, partial [Rhizoctonia solani AG-8 WAC10335]
MIHALSFCFLVSATLPAFGLASETEDATSMHDFLPKITLLSRSAALFIVSVLLDPVVHVGCTLVKDANALRQLDGPPSSSPLLDTRISCRSSTNTCPSQGHLELIFNPVKGMTTQGEVLNAYGSVCKLNGVPGWHEFKVDGFIDRTKCINHDRS